jgi:hypothetical protein
MLSSANRGRRQTVWNEIEVLLIKVKEETEELPSQRISVDREGSIERLMNYQSAKGNQRAPIQTEECQQGSRSATSD